MKTKKPKFRRGLTLAELLTVVTVAAIVVSGVGIVLVDSQRGWNRMYTRMYNDVSADALIARKTFDSVMRKASRERISVSVDGDWIEVYYYADDDSDEVDSYARFYHQDGQLNVEYGSLDPMATERTDTICGNVSTCVFMAVGRSAQMILTLDNGSQTVTVTGSSVLHNQ